MQTLSVFYLHQVEGLSKANKFRKQVDSVQISHIAFFPQDSERINIFADGPCGSSVLSLKHLHIHFLNCTCPVGFEPSYRLTQCKCVCDSRVSTYTTNCKYTTNSLLRVDSNLWITYTHAQSGYIIYPFCPYDYCQSPLV